MQRILFLIGFAMLTCGTLVSGGIDRAPHATPAPELTNAEPSAERLIDRFLGALASKDPDALRRLRVTEAEYRGILLPGTVPEGQPLKRPSKELADLAWGLTDTKSHYYEQSLLQEFGGRQLRLKATSYEKGEERFSSYSAHKQVRLTLEDTTSGAELVLGTGSVIEVAGRYKFISFIRDN